MGRSHTTLTPLAVVVVSTLLVSTQGGCEFPKEWSGRWFQSGVPGAIGVNGTHFETKGRCVEAEGDKFVIEDRSDSCYRCVVVHERHKNVLQYKETYCDRRDTLSNLCNQLTGDATLFTMFRQDAKPEACPFRGAPFTFTYSRGGGECGSPVSRVDPCTDESRLLLRYQACPDVTSTESTTEELVCLAFWKEGSSHYLVGKLHHNNAHSDEDRYRCFVYARGASGGGRERSRVTYSVAQSGDATCNGLQSVSEGSRTMRLTKVDGHGQRCRYPSWITDHHAWHTLDHRHSFHFSQKNATLRVTTSDPTTTERIVCHSLEPATERQATIVAHSTSGCTSGYVCLTFYRRDGHVMELQRTTTPTQLPEEACRHFHAATLPYVTLITATPKLLACPHLGRYSAVSRVDATALATQPALHSDVQTRPAQPPCGLAQVHSLAVGCAALDTMQFLSSCAHDAVSAYSCHGSWAENGTLFVVASPVSRQSVGARRTCFVYATSPAATETTLSLASVSDSCPRQAIDGVAWAFDLTHHASCGDSGATDAAPSAAAVVFLAATTLSLASLCDR